MDGETRRGVSSFTAWRKKTEALHECTWPRDEKRRRREKRGSGYVECITRRHRIHRWRVSGLMAAPVPPKHTMLQSCVKTYRVKTDRGKNINQSSRPFASSGWLSWRRKPAGSRESFAAVGDVTTRVRACTLEPLFALPFQVPRRENREARRRF